MGEWDDYYRQQQYNNEYYEKEQERYQDIQQEQYGRYMEDQEEQSKRDREKSSASGDLSFAKHFLFSGRGGICGFVIRIYVFFIYIVPFWIWKLLLDLTGLLLAHRRFIAGTVLALSIVLGITTAVADAQIGGQLTGAVNGEEMKSTVNLKNLNGEVKATLKDADKKFGYKYVSVMKNVFKIPAFNTRYMSDYGELASEYYYTTFGKNADYGDKVLSFVITLYPVTACYFMIYILLLSYRIMIAAMVIEFVVFIIQKVTGH